MNTSQETKDAELPLHKAAQRLRWLLAAFEEHVQEATSKTGVAFSINSGELATALADWLKAFLELKLEQPEENETFVGFAAGLMLRSLVRRNPVRVVSLPESLGPEDPATFWPEGYLYVGFCLKLRGEVIEKDFQGIQQCSDDMSDVQVWWSFRENAGRDPEVAVAFLEHFASGRPGWELPGVFGKTARPVANRPGNGAV